MTTEQQTFANATREALSNLHDTARLQTSPLVGWLGLDAALTGATPSGAAAALRELLQATIAALRPAEDAPAETPAWLTYQILWRRYVQGASRFIICDDLSLGQATYYRHHRQGLEAVSDMLWRQRQRAAHEPEARPAVESAPETAGSPTTASPADARLRAMSLATRSRSEAAPFAELLASSIELIAPLLAQHQVQIEGDIAPQLPPLYGDPAIIRQILINTLAEAVKHASGPRLQVRLSHIAGIIRLQIGALSTAQRDVLDSAEGLRDSRSLLAAYGGVLTLTETAPGLAQLEIEAPTGQPATVLIIDDDADTIQLYQRYLQGHNYVIQVAPNADEARRFIHAHPRIILLDILMAKEDGWDILRYVQSTPALADIPIIICSVLSQPELALAMGAFAVLKKPISEQDLTTAIAAALALANSAD